MKMWIYRDGHWYDEHGKLIRDDVLADGGSVRVPFMVADGLPKGVTSVSDALARKLEGMTPEQRKAYLTGEPAKGQDAALAAVDAAYDDYEKRICDAWRNPPMPDNSKDQEETPAPADANHSAVDAAYAEYDRRITEAYNSCQ